MPAGSLGKMLVGNIIRTAALRHGGNEAIVCTGTGRRFTYRELNRRVNRLGQGLLGSGLAKGDVVAFLSTNRAEMVEIYFALAKTGIVGIPLNYRLATPEIVELMRSMGATGLIFEDRFEAVAREVATALPAVTTRVAIGAEGGGTIGYESLLAGAPDAEPTVALDESDPYYFNLTSGTTGLPKSYVLTQFNNSTVGAFFQTLEMSRRDTVLTVFPMFGRVAFGWMASCATHGIRNVLLNFEADEALSVIERERVTIVILVPTMGAMLLAAGSLPRRDLSSLRGIVYVGSMLPAPIREQTMAKLCPAIYEYYGMQESGTLVVSTPEDRALRPDSVGRAILHAEVRVVDAEGRDLPPGEIGEVVGRSPGAVTAYYENPAKSAETFRNGWLHTGDLGRLDEEGYLTICGRLKDMIISGGQNVHSAEIEEAILSYPGVRDCAVIGLPDELWGERVTAVVVAETALDAEALRAFCRERLAGFKTPKEFFVRVDPLPRTPTGKVQKFLLVDQYRASA